MKHKRLLALLLAVIMVFAMVPTAAFAASNLTAYRVDQSGKQIAGSTEISSNDYNNAWKAPTVPETPSGYTYVEARANKASGPVIYQIEYYNSGYWWESSGWYYKTAANSNKVQLTSIYFVYKSSDGKVTLSFDANGGDGVPDAIREVPGTTVTLPTIPETREGYEFLGWTTAPVSFPDPTYYAVYKAGSNYELPDSNTTLYAAWQSSNPGSSNTNAYFYIRLDGQIPYEPGSYLASAYTTGIQMTGAIKVQNWVVDVDTTKTIADNHVVNDVTTALNRTPSTTLIQQVCSASGVTYNPETQYILWYVQKYQALGESAVDESGSPISTSGSGWHIDGVLLERGKVAISYDANVPTGVTTTPDVPQGYQVVSGTTVTVGQSGGVNGDFDRETPSIPGYTFLGWNTRADGTGTMYQVRDTIKLTENMVLYAIWKANYFYIFHTADVENGRPSFEAVSMDPNTDGWIQNEEGDYVYNIVAKTKAGFLYGGYYEDYGKKGGYSDANRKITEDAETYTGDQTSWNANDAIHVSGFTMEPEVGKTYFLKEVPTSYLQPKIYYVYDENSNPENELKQIYEVTAIDDLNYQFVGFDGQNAAAGEQSVSKDTVYNSFEVKKLKDWTSGNTITYPYNLKSFFASLESGYLGIRKYTGTVGPEQSFVFTPYFVTPDGVKVTGAKQRTVKMGNGYYLTKVGALDPLGIEDTDISITTSLYTTGSAANARSLSLMDAYAIDWDEEISVTEPDKPEIPEDTEVTITKVIDEVDEVEIPVTVDAGDCTGLILSEEQPGKVFVGWFTKDGKPADFTNVQEDMTVYAKYIPTKSVRLNVTTSKGRGGVVNVTASLSLPGAKVAEVGFLTDDGYEQADSYRGASYRAAWTTSASSNTVTVTPYWVTLDGTTVYGEPGTYRIRTNNSSLWGF